MHACTPKFSAAVACQLLPVTMCHHAQFFRLLYAGCLQDEAVHVGRLLCSRMKQLLDRQQFEVVIQVSLEL